APFDRTMVTAASPALEPHWLQRISAHSLLVVPPALASALAHVACGMGAAGVFHGRLARPPYLMALRAPPELGAADEDPTRGAPPDGVPSGRHTKRGVAA